MLSTIIEEIQNANTIALTTHKQCDGDGLGSQLAVYHALNILDKKVHIMNVDTTPAKYNYLLHEIDYHEFQNMKHVESQADLVLVFDTNDYRMLEDVYEHYKKQGSKILFIDHHPILKEGPQPTDGSWINTKSASTGEMAFELIKNLNVSLNEKISEALYTSICFDTQLFRFIRGSAKSHLIAAELLDHYKSPEKVHQNLFGNLTVEKTNFLSFALGKIEFFENNRAALLVITNEDLINYSVGIDETRDLIDMIMNIKIVETAAFFREDGPNQFKLSLRSKGGFPISPIAEKLDGGGHPFAAGAFLNGELNNFIDIIKKDLSNALKKQ